MGCCCSTTSNQVPSNYGAKEHQAEKRVHKLLLLGIGSSGKSTIYKQLQLIYGGGINDQTIRDSTDIIRQNILLGIVKLLLASHALVNIGSKFADCKVDINEQLTKRAVDFVFQYRASLNRMRKQNSTYNMENDSKNINTSIKNDANGIVSSLSSSTDFELTHKYINWEHVDDLKKNLIYLWELPSIQNTFKHRNCFAFPDNMEYFLNQIDTIFNENYVPSQADFIKTRIRTTGIISSRFEIPMGRPSDKNISDKCLKIDIIDVGGQRNERRKWIYQLDCCTATVFVAALNHYCSKLFVFFTFYILCLF